MPLTKYHQKRDFKKTPEPKGKVTKSSRKKLLYIIQKHAASHLHYDFRLELNGVLLSWAVPKGPCLDPSVKRLAMHVEDHPVEYGHFEGIIPKGQYGGGTVMLWDQGEWVCVDENPMAAYKKGDLKFQLKAKRLKGLWKLIRINNNDKTWLLIKGKDKYAQSMEEYDITVEETVSVISKRTMQQIANNADASWQSKEKKKKSTDSNVKKKLKSALKINKILPTLTLPKSAFPKKVSPQLATLVDKPPVGAQWVHEIKFDGYRLLAFKQNKTVKLFTRNNNDWTDQFPSVARAIQQLPINNAIVDGEVVVLDHHHQPNFQLLQNAIKNQDAEFVYYAFDLLYVDQWNVMKLPLSERKEILSSILAQNDDQTIRYSEHVSDAGDKVLHKTCALGLEGMMSKDLNSTYIGKRNRHWLKIKCHQRQEFVIGGFLKSEKRNEFRSLMLGTFDHQKKLNYHGNVGTGFTQESLSSLQKLLNKHVTTQMPFIKKPPEASKAIWVKPILVAEVEFTEWTNEDTLRHPSFKGLRNDKKAAVIKKEVELPVEKVMLNQSVKLTHADKILYAEGNITKQDLYDYYEQVQSWILPYVINRPLTLVRCPHNYKKCFFQKHIEKMAGFHPIKIKEKEGTGEYFYISDAQGLLLLPQLNTLELHIWGSTIKSVEKPDMLVFDLDPGPRLPWKQLVKAAVEIKKLFEQLKLKSFVKTTGGKGLHVVIPIKPEHDWLIIKKFSKAIVDYLVSSAPDKYVGVMTKSKRTNKIFLDYLRNQRGATAVAPYSTRARAHAPVSVPLHWDELTSRQPIFTINNISKRLKSLKKDPWADFFNVKQRLLLKDFE